MPMKCVSTQAVAVEHWASLVTIRYLPSGERMAEVRLVNMVQPQTKCDRKYEKRARDSIGLRVRGFLGGIVLTA